MVPVIEPRAAVAPAESSHLTTTHTYGARAARLSPPESPRGPVGLTTLIMFWVWFWDSLRSYYIGDESGMSIF